MTEYPYINFYTSDFLGGTGGMTASTKGVYITILCLIYETEGPLPQKWDVLARRCGCTLPAFKRAVSDLVDDEKLEITDAGLWSDKCTKHITLRRERRNSAKAAAQKRWKKSVQKQGKADADAKREQCQPEPEPDKSEVTNVTSRRLAPPSDGFDAFWNLWPSKKNKDAALKAWCKLSLENRRKAYAAIRDGWFDRWQADSPDANPIHASTFLNKRRWEDTFTSRNLRQIQGGAYGKSTSAKSEQRMQAFIAGARSTGGSS